MHKAVGLGIDLKSNFDTETPELYTELFARLPTNIEKLRSASGDRLPEVEHEIVIKARLEKTSSYLGALASRAEFSTVTGCWSILKGRNSKGYVQIYNAHQYGLNRAEGKNYGIGSHRLAYLLKLKDQGLAEQITTEHDIDHICRNTACCNPDHLRAVDKTENNRLKIKAERIEKAVAIGQMMLGNIGIGWFDKTLTNSEEEDTGMVVSTRFGPYRIIKVNQDPLMSYGIREPCDVFDSLKKPPKDSRVRKSRAKKPKIIHGQESLT